VAEVTPAPPYEPSWEPPAVVPTHIHACAMPAFVDQVKVAEAPGNALPEVGLIITAGWKVAAV
jgi:hypothetical protein